MSGQMGSAHILLASVMMYVVYAEELVEEQDRGNGGSPTILSGTRSMLDRMAKKQRERSLVVSMMTCQSSEL